MSIEFSKIKEQIYILHRLLNQEYQDRDFSISECNDMVAKMNGFIDWDDLQNNYQKI
jgi:hypothetical protein